MAAREAWDDAQAQPGDPAGAATADVEDLSPPATLP
jgi:hypothetical protein